MDEYSVNIHLTRFKEFPLSNRHKGLNIKKKKKKKKKKCLAYNVKAKRKQI